MDVTDNKKEAKRRLVRSAKTCVSQDRETEMFTKSKRHRETEAERQRDRETDRHSISDRVCFLI